MQMKQIVETVRRFDGALVVTPDAGGAMPELSWGDAFFYYAPDGQVPQHIQPYGTIVTKDYPDDTASRLGAVESGPDRWRVNIHVDRKAFERLTGEAPRELTRPRDFTAVDEFAPHPVYGRLGWVAVVNPAERTMGTVIELLREAHDAAGTRYRRRREA